MIVVDLRRGPRNVVETVVGVVVTITKVVVIVGTPKDPGTSRPHKTMVVVLVVVFMVTV